MSLGAVAAGLAIVALVMAQQPAPPASVANAGVRTSEPAITLPSTAIPPGLADGASLGRRTAPVTLEIWSDYQCPFCGQLARSYLPRLVDEFVAPGTVRIFAQDIAFLDRGASTESRDAAKAAACAADQGRFWAFHDLLMWNQAGENAGAFSDARLRAMASRAGLEPAAWNACRVAGSTERDVAARTQRAGQLGIVSTPTLIINGQAIVGLPKTYEMLAAAIRGSLAAGAALPAVRSEASPAGSANP